MEKRDFSRLKQIECMFLDLDGTLLGMKEDIFSTVYTKLAATHFQDLLPAETFVEKLLECTFKMMNNTEESILLWDVFFDCFESATGIQSDVAGTRFMNFYTSNFADMEKHVQKIAGANLLIEKAKKMDIKLILATNPVFPEIATQKRVTWAGLDYTDFDFVTHGENSSFCKPYPQYFETLLEIVNIEPNNILMVGNDYGYDMSASQVGIITWLTDTHIGAEKYKGRYKVDYQGSLEVLARILDN